MTPEEDTDFHLWESELPVPTFTQEEAEIAYPWLFEVKTLPKEGPGVFSELLAWIVFALGASLPWALIGLLVLTIAKVLL